MMRLRGMAKSSFLYVSFLILWYFFRHWLRRNRQKSDLTFTRC